MVENLFCFAPFKRLSCASEGPYVGHGHHLLLFFLVTPISFSPPVRPTFLPCNGRRRPPPFLLEASAPTRIELVAPPELPRVPSIRLICRRGPFFSCERVVCLTLHIFSIFSLILSDLSTGLTMGVSRFFLRSLECGSDWRAPFFARSSLALSCSLVCRSPVSLSPPFSLRFEAVY